MPTQLLNSDEARERCGYQNRISFMAAVRNYGIPHIRFNARRIMFDPDALDEWMRARTIGSTKRKGSR
jgi:hypothetical protein